MLTYVLKRLLLMIPTMLGVLTVTFIVIQFVPGGPVEQLVAEMRAGARGEGPGAGGTRGRRDLDAKQIEEIKKLYGFDKPPIQRYFEMLGNFARFDLGRSFMHNKDVWQLIKEKLPVSISLGLWTFLLSYLISIPLGVAKAVREGSRFDTIDHAAGARGFCAPRLCARRAADRAVRGRDLPRLVSAARSHFRQLGQLELARRVSPITFGIWCCRSRAMRSAASPRSPFSPRTRLSRKSASSTCWSPAPRDCPSAACCTSTCFATR